MTVIRREAVHSRGASPGSEALSQAGVAGPRIVLHSVHLSQMLHKVRSSMESFLTTTSVAWFETPY